MKYVARGLTWHTVAASEGFMTVISDLHVSARTGSLETSQTAIFSEVKTGETQ
jgi:hypothetical protein